MAGKLTAAQGTGILLVTANVGSLFEDPENLQKTWLKEFCQTVQSHKPHFLAVHCQEVGGKNYEASMTHVDSFVKELLSTDAMKEYSRACVYLDENYKSQEQFTITLLQRFPQMCCTCRMLCFHTSPGKSGHCAATPLFEANSPGLWVIILL